MLQELKSDIQSTVAPLIGAIADDVMLLVRQEVELAKSEIRQEIKKSKGAASTLIAGAALGMVAFMLLGLGIAQFLAWAFPTLPLWMCYGIVAAFSSGIAALLFERGNKTASSINMLPYKTIESMKENFAWTKERI